MDSNIAAPPTIAELAVQRELFDIPRTVSYLNCANMSPQLRAVTAAGVAAVQGRTAPWTIRPEDWFVRSERLRTCSQRLSTRMQTESR